MWVQDGCQTVFLAIDWESACDLCEDSDIVDLIRIINDIFVRRFVLKEECANVLLAPPHHLLYCSSNIRVTDRDCFVEARKQRSLGYWYGHDLRVYFRNARLLYRPLVGGFAATLPTTISSTRLASTSRSTATFRIASAADC